jgi:hypothetical protein
MQVAYENVVNPLEFYREAAQLHLCALAAVEQEIAARHVYQL